MKKITLALTLAILLLISVELQLVNLATANFIAYLPKITIKTDGSIEPKTDFIKQVGDLYTLTADLSQNSSLVIQRSNIVFDGKGHVVNGSLAYLGYANVGLCVEGVTNVTIKNIEVIGFIDRNILIENSSGVSLIGVKTQWLHLMHSNFCSIAESIIGLDGNAYDLEVDFSSNNIFTKNNITYLLWISSSENNRVYENNISSIYLTGNSSSNSFIKNNFGCQKNYFESIELNFWDNGTVGNYWSNYKGGDADCNGIGDTPYFIYSQTPDETHSKIVEIFSGQDNYPLMVPYVVPPSPSPTPEPQPETEPTLTALTLAASGLTIAGVVVCLLFFYKKRKPPNFG